MNIKIGEKTHEIIFGVGFVRRLDEKYYLTNGTGLKFGFGLSHKIPELLSHNVVALSEILYEGTCTEKERPTQEEVDRYIDQCDNVEGLFDEVVEELKKSNATKRETEKLIEEMKKAEAEKKAKAEAKKQKTGR